MTPGSDLVLAAPLELIEGHRNESLRLFGEAFDMIELALEHMAKAAPSQPTPYFRDTGQRLSERGPQGRARFLKETRQDLDRAAWRHLLSVSGMERLMDQTAKKLFEAQLRDDPPEVSADTCRATMEGLFADAPTIFKRGIAESFSSLDRRFKSHDGFKIGSRIVLTRAFNEHGSWASGYGAEAKFRDVERTFYVLDKKQHPDRGDGILGVIDAARPRSFHASAFAAEDDYFRVRVFKNGNLHVWFKRDDLLLKVNELLADYYGAVLADSRQKKAAVPEQRAPARHFSYFPTPDAPAAEVMDAAMIKDGMSVLEPSAGCGNLARRAIDAGARVTVVELDQQHIGKLQDLAGVVRVIHDDFLAQDPAVIGRFDRVIMNPPFCDGRDVDHVRHALRFVAPGGRLVAIMSAGVVFKEDADYVELRSLIEASGGRIRDLPARSFASVGTNINTCIVTISVRGS
ncbi:DUF4942 domain-containing protein [Brevundimonas nasdae]|uniref:DUF4942 domain-containing protein n=1 Tax=Brevundimonas nasdae TaxID=172043 RepID=UPI003F68D5BF